MNERIEGFDYSVCEIERLHDVVSVMNMNVNVNVMLVPRYHCGNRLFIDVDVDVDEDLDTGDWVLGTADGVWIY